jgi:hypothetical protein
LQSNLRRGSHHAGILLPDLRRVDPSLNMKRSLILQN